MIERHGLAAVCPLLFSPVHEQLDPADLARWLLDAGLRARLQLPMHKILWPEAMRGV